MHGHRLVDDEAIAQKLADGLAGVGGGDLVNFIGIEPDLALAAADHGGRQALLGAKVDPAILKKQWFFFVSQKFSTGFVDCACALLDSGRILLRSNLRKLGRMVLRRLGVDEIGVAVGDAEGTYILMPDIIDGRSLTDWMFEFPQSILTTTDLRLGLGKWTIS